MAIRQQNDLEKLFQEALRLRIGENRYQMWFAVGVRFALSGDVLTVRVGNEFMCDWLRSGYLHEFEQVGRELLGVDMSVSVVHDPNLALVDPADASTASSESTPEVSQNDSGAEFVSPQNIPTRPELSNAGVPAFNLSASSFTPDSNPVSNVTPPKRRRGRPPKSAQTSSASSGAASLFELPLTTSDVLYSNGTRLDQAQRAQIAVLERQAAVSESFNQAPFANAPSYPSNFIASPQEPAEPPKRGRGRPRKNPVPTETTNGVASNANVPSAATQPPASFFDAFNRSVSANAALQNVAAQSAAANLDLSESERVAWSVGNFDDAPRAASTRTPSFGAEPVVPRAPGKRGRPKGSTNRRPPAYNPTNEDDGVSRDANGFNVVMRPKETARVKVDDYGAYRLASLSTFVEGFSNRLALRVADVAIAEPGAMSPIFVCGPTSVGKTHLLEGICDAYLRRQDIKPPLYMTSEQFTSAFIQSLRGGGAFRDRFKNISLFALDDVHFLEGKLSTQSELLNVVDFLSARHVQMVFSANRPLSELTKLRGELTTRIESGVVCKIENPERETLAQILRQMALERRIVVPDDVCRYVVSRFATHARQLSGVLNRLLATCLTTGVPITLDLAREALADMSASGFRNIKLDDVERAVQEVFGLESNALKSASRARKCADPRAVAMWLARKHTRAALTEIGDFFGGRKHSAVLFAQKKVDEWLQTNELVDAGDVSYAVSEAIERVERVLVNSRS